jgi:hypothetical protein
LAGKPERKRPVEKVTGRKNYIKMDVRETGWEVCTGCI